MRINARRRDPRDIGCMALTKEQLLAEAARCRLEAVRMRSRAQDMSSPEVRQTVFAMAETYERIARELAEDAVSL